MTASNGVERGSRRRLMVLPPQSQQRPPLTPASSEWTTKRLSECDEIRYSAYRMAAKVDIVQQSLKLGSVKFGVVCNVLQHHGLSSAAALNSVGLTKEEASDVIADIFFATSKIRCEDNCSQESF